MLGESGAPAGAGEALDLASVPGAEGPPPEEGDRLIDEAADDVEVRCHARATAGKMPPSRCLHSATCVDDKLYVFGGKGASGPLGDLHVLDMKTSTWTAAKPGGAQPAARFGHAAVSPSAECILMFGGMASGHSTFNFGGGGGRGGGGGGADGGGAPASGEAPAVGGAAAHGAGQLERQQECVDELYELALPGLEWSLVAPSKGSAPSPRYKHTATCIPGRKGRASVFVFGGCTDEGDPLSDQHMLDCDTKAWTIVDSHGEPPSPRFGHSATYLPSRKIIVLGGTDGVKPDEATAPLDPELPPHRTTKSLHPMTLHVLDLDTLTWSQPVAKGANTGAEPSARCYHSAALCGKNLFVLGGQVHAWLLANHHYVHGTYILETSKLEWEHNTIKGDSFIPYPGASLLGHTATAADASSLYLAFGTVESTSAFEYSRIFWDIATDAKQKLNPSVLPKPTDGGAYNTTFKLLCVGDAGVGKTCLVTRFVEDMYSESNKSTIGVDFKTMSLEMDGRSVGLQLWDTAGQERFRSLTSAYYRGAHGVVLVYDCTDAHTFENLLGWMKDLNAYCGEEAVKLLISNKTDASERRVVTAEQGQDFANEHGLLFMEASAKTATNVKAAFRLLVAEVMHKADTLASQPPAFQEKVKLHAERSSRYRKQGGVQCCQ